MRQVFTLIALLAISVSIRAQSILWEKSYGGTKDDQPQYVLQTDDNGFLAVGYSNSNDGDVTGHHGDTSSYDYWVTKMDSNGLLLWQKSLGGSLGDYAEGAIYSKDGGFVITGQSYSNDGNVTGHHGYSNMGDYWVVKIDSVGNLVWQKSLGGTGDDQSDYIAQTSDKGYILIGSSNSNDGDVTGNHGLHDIWVVKIDSVGNLVWQKSYGGSMDDFAQTIKQTFDHGYILTGNSNSNDGDVTGNHGSFDFWVVKIDSVGNLVWQKSLGGTGSEGAYSIQQTTDSGYIAVGYSSSNDGDVTGNHGDWDYWVVKLNSHGSLIWEKSLGGSGHDGASDVQQTNDNGYIIAGASPSNDGDVTGNHGATDCWIVKLDSSGAKVWEKSYGGLYSEGINCIQQISNNSFVFIAPSQSNDGDVTGHHGYSSTSDYWVVKIDGMPTGINSIMNPLLSYVYPNPTIDKLILKVSSDFAKGDYKLTDITGKEIQAGKIQSEISELTVSDLTSGLYFLEIINQNRQVFKVIKQ